MRSQRCKFIEAQILFTPDSPVSAVITDLQHHSNGVNERKMTSLAASDPCKKLVLPVICSHYYYFSPPARRMNRQVLQFLQIFSTYYSFFAVNPKFNRYNFVLLQKMRRRQISPQIAPAFIFNAMIYL